MNITYDNVVSNDFKTIKVLNNRKLKCKMFTEEHVTLFIKEIKMHIRYLHLEYTKFNTIKHKLVVNTIRASFNLENILNELWKIVSNKKYHNNWSIEISYVNNR